MYVPVLYSVIPVKMYVQYFYGHTYLTQTLCAKPNIAKKYDK